MDERKGILAKVGTFHIGSRGRASHGQTEGHLIAAIAEVANCHGRNEGHL